MVLIYFVKINLVFRIMDPLKRKSPAQQPLRTTEHATRTRTWDYKNI